MTSCHRCGSSSQQPGCEEVRRLVCGGRTSTSTTVDVLRRHLGASARASTPGDGVAARGLVFCGPDGEPLHPERVYQAFRRALIRHKMPTIPLHGLRHTWATIALQAGVHPRVVQERLGHSNIAITLQTYSHVLPTMHDEAAASVAGHRLRSRVATTNGGRFISRWSSFRHLSDYCR